jgi:tRNA 2-thiouridine synthesizing protein A
MTPRNPPRFTAAGDPPAAQLDVRGTLCPVPVLRTARWARRLAAGALLEVVGDDPLMRLDLAAWCAREGHEVVLLETGEGGRVRCVLRVGGGAASG